jgi:hypothetical protein
VSSASLPLFDMSIGEAFALCKKVPIGSRIVRVVRDRGVGPDWQAWVPGPDKTSVRAYIGDDAARARVERAWELVGARLEELEDTANRIEAEHRRVLAMLERARERIRTMRDPFIAKRSRARPVRETLRLASGANQK